MFDTKACRRFSGLHAAFMAAAVVALFVGSAAAKENAETRAADHPTTKGKSAAQPVAQKTDKQIIAEQMPFYPLDTCVVTGNKIGEMGEGVNYVYNGRLVRFCCNACPKDFEKDPDKYIKKINKAVIEKQKPGYPLNTCLVTGDELDEHGKPIDYVVNNRLIRLCCKNCVRSVEKNPDKYLAQLDEAIAKAKSAKTQAGEKKSD